MPAAAASIESPTTAQAPGNPLADLLAERDRISAELERLYTIDQRRVESEAALSTVDGELAALSQTEAMAWQAWAADPQSERPQPRRSERMALAQRRAEAAAELDVARVASAAVLPRVQALSAELNGVGRRILEVRVGQVVAEAHATHLQAVEAAAKVASPMTKLVALQNSLRNELGAAQNSGDDFRVRLVGGAFGAISSLAPPVVLADPAELLQAESRWRDALR